MPRARRTARSSTTTSFRAIVEPLGRPLEQRTTLYGRATTVGSRLRPPPEQVEADQVAAAATSSPSRSAHTPAGRVTANDEGTRDH